MDKIRIIQIGAGGTGSWFARALMHSMAQIYKAADNRSYYIKWIVIDPDTVEPRNLIRQPFYGGTGANKSDYLAGLIDNLFSYLKLSFSVFSVKGMLRGTIDDIEKELEDINSGNHLTMVQAASKSFAAGSIAEGVMLELKAGVAGLPGNDDGDDIKTFLVSCVDNTYTRQLLEQMLCRLPGREGIFYVNMGVSPQGAWLAELIPAGGLLPTRWESLTYPDQMMSCAQREEAGPVPQTVYSNMMAGATASQLIMTALTLDEPPEVKRVFGENFVSEILPQSDYYLERISAQEDK